MISKRDAVVAPEFLCALATLLLERNLLGAGDSPPFIRISGPLVTYIDCFMEDFITDSVTYVREGGFANIGSVWGWNARFRENFTWDKV